MGRPALSARGPERPQRRRQPAGIPFAEQEPLHGVPQGVLAFRPGLPTLDPARTGKVAFR